MSDANVRESDATLREQWVTTEAAASLLSVSIRTVQKRVREGKLLSRQEGRRLLVCVHVREQDANLRESPSEVRESPTDDPLLEQMRSEIQFLRAELEKRNTAEGELRRLMLTDRRELSELREQVRLLHAAPSEPMQETTGSPETTQAAEGHAQDVRPWWKRIFG
jgi:phage terminase Nu1 subunit (DNA packaging protein)